MKETAKIIQSYVFEKKSSNRALTADILFQFGISDIGPDLKVEPRISFWILKVEPLKCRANLKRNSNFQIIALSYDSVGLSLSLLLFYKFQLQESFSCFTFRLPTSDFQICYLFSVLHLRGSSFKTQNDLLDSSFK